MLCAAKLLAIVVAGAFRNRQRYSRLILSPMLRPLPLAQLNEAIVFARNDACENASGEYRGGIGTLFPPTPPRHVSLPALRLLAARLPRRFR